MKKYHAEETMEMRWRWTRIIRKKIDKIQFENFNNNKVDAQQQHEKQVKKLNW